MARVEKNVIIEQPKGTIITVKHRNGTVTAELEWNKSFGVTRTKYFTKAQKYVDETCIRRMVPYTPKRTGVLIKSATLFTTIGSGLIVQKMPYGRRLYYNPQYKFVGAPMRGAYWFKRMVADRKTSILKEARIIAGGG